MALDVSSVLAGIQNSYAQNINDIYGNYTNAYEQSYASLQNSLAQQQASKYSALQNSINSKLDQVSAATGISRSSILAENPELNDFLGTTSRSTAASTRPNSYVFTPAASTAQPTTATPSNPREFSFDSAAQAQAHTAPRTATTPSQPAVTKPTTLATAAAIGNPTAAAQAQAQQAMTQVQQQQRQQAQTLVNTLKQNGFTEDQIFAENPDLREILKPNGNTTTKTSDGITTYAAPAQATSVTTRPQTTTAAPQTSPNLSNQLANRPSSTAASNPMKLNNDTITDVISKISQIINSVETQVNDLTKNEIDKINNSWAATEASAYVAKVNEAAGRIKQVIEGLRILSNTYSKVLTQTGSTQSQVNQIIQSL